MRVFIVLLLALLATPAVAGDLLVQVRQANGAPVPNAVVLLYPGGRPAPLPANPGSYQITQRDLQFSPFVMVVPVGAQISFPNLDPVQHHVYSFSPVRRFELRLYAREQSRSVRFDRAGIVPLGCNIHDSMIAFINVADTGLAARTDGNGRVLFANAPAGPVQARLWHPWLRVPGNQAQFNWTIPASGREGRLVTVNLRPPPAAARTY
jgi:hypothetical protein